MTFTTPTFLVFLVVVFGTYWMLSRRAQNLLLVAASLVFYGWWDWRFLGLLLATGGLDYGVALALEGTRDERRRRALLGLSLLANLGALGIFKYFDFFSRLFSSLISSPENIAALPLIETALPVGISFYTFLTLYHTIDVWRGDMLPERYRAWSRPSSTRSAGMAPTRIHRCSRDFEARSRARGPATIAGISNESTGEPEACL